jgi:molybdopterin converting factor small subunit
LATIVIPPLLRRHTRGAEHLELDVADVRGLFRALDERFPGIAEVLRDEVAVAIDGEIVSDPLLEPIEPDSEVHFLPKIGGG